VVEDGGEELEETEEDSIVSGEEADLEKAKGKATKVAFEEGNVTGILRPLTNDEHWTLYYFENHATTCRSCHDPLRISEQGRKLCNTGHDLAVDVTDIIFRTSDGKIHSRQDSHRDIRLEIPGDYVETVSLLKAIQRAMRKGDHFVKYQNRDKSYFVPDRRIPERSASRSPRYETRVAPQSFHSRRDDTLGDFSEIQRGTHFNPDMGELEKAMKLEQRVPYIELRVPSYLKSSRHSQPPPSQDAPPHATTQSQADSPQTQSSPYE
jgi:hypothetical protein